jgi:hypothetical protein
VDDAVVERVREPCPRLLLPNTKEKPIIETHKVFLFPPFKQ